MFGHDAIGGHALSSARWTAWCPRQCRTGWPKAPQLTPATGSGGPHDVRNGIIRRQGGRLPRFPVQRVGMRLRATGIFRHSDCIAGRLPYLLGICSSDTTGESLYIMPVAGQLLHAQRRGADSAGHIRPPPSTPRLSPLRRGSHNVRHSTVAGCWRLQI